MTAFEFDRARREHPKSIVFTVVKDGSKRLIVMPASRAKEVHPRINWTFGALHGTTVHLRKD